MGAFLEVADFLSEERARTTGSPPTDFSLALTRRRVDLGLRTLTESRHLTDHGRRVVESMARRSARWEDPTHAEAPIAEEAEELAREETADHWLRWRLTNLRPDHARIEVTAAAWLLNGPVP